MQITVRTDVFYPPSPDEGQRQAGSQPIVLDLNGVLDASTVSKLTVWFSQSLPPTQARVVVNLSQVTFIDSSGLSALVQGMKRCRERGGDLRICGLQASVRLIFELTRLDKAFEIYTREEDALRSYQS